LRNSNRISIFSVTTILGLLRVGCLFSMTNSCGCALFQGFFFSRFAVLTSIRLAKALSFQSSAVAVWFLAVSIDGGHVLRAQDTVPAPSIAAVQGPADVTTAVVPVPLGPVEKVKDGFQFTEGPAWGPDQALYFTDIPANRIFRFSPKDDSLNVFIEPAGHSNGLMFDTNGKLLACQMDGQLVSIDLSSKEVSVLSDKHNNVRFNACNDLVIDQQGGVYFTDPRYQSPEPYPQGTEAFYYRAPDGTVSRLGQDLLAPNGIGLSPDGLTLYVVPSMQKQIMAYPIEAPGKIGAGRVLFELKQPEGEDNTGGDGMTVDATGNLYITSALGVQICDSQGKLLNIITLAEVPANVTFGGEDFDTLYITARKGLYRCRMPVKGLVFGKKL
jgi:gluconolactonase